MQKVNLDQIKRTSLGVAGSVIITEHFRSQMKSKGIPAENVIAALRAPERVTDVRRYPGQKRYCGYGVAVVMDGQTAITLYLDQVVTPLRPDQMHDKKALNSIRAGIRNA